MIVTDLAEGDHPPPLPAARTLERFLAAAAAAIPLRGQVSVLITSDKVIRKLNRQFRGKNKATDVLSFPAADVKLRGRARVAGDLAISIEMAARQALLLKHPLATELKVLMLHGLLHLAGFDHETDKGQMAAHELVLRRKLRLPGGLIERTEDTAPATEEGAPSWQSQGGKSRPGQEGDRESPLSQWRDVGHPRLRLI